MRDNRAPFKRPGRLTPHEWREIDDALEEVSREIEVVLEELKRLDKETPDKE